MFNNLTNDNILIYAIKSYEGLNYIKSEFNEDYRVFRYIKRLLQRYRNTNEIKINLILNHIIFVYNTFGQDAGTRLLFFKVQKEDYSYLKTILIFLDRMPTVIRGINGADIESSDIPVDMAMAELLRRI